MVYSYIQILREDPSAFDMGPGVPSVIVVSKIADLAPVVQRLDNAIQWINVNITNHAIRWLVRLRVVPALSLGPSCVTRKKIVRKKMAA